MRTTLMGCGSIGGSLQLTRLVVTAEADVAVGIMPPVPPQPLDTYAPLDLVYAPLTRTHRSHLGQVRVVEHCFMVDRVS